MLRVEVMYCPAPGEVDRSALELDEGATVLDALRASGVLRRHPEIDLDHASAGIWNRIRPLDAPLRDRDRVELYRPLTVDPKQARRSRAARQQKAPNGSPKR